MNTRDVIQTCVTQHNAKAARTAHDLEPWARLAAAVAMAAVGAAVLLWAAEPCDTGHQCAGLLLAPATTLRNRLRGTWLHRAWVWPRCAYLRWRMAYAQAEIDDMELTLCTVQLAPRDRIYLQSQTRSHRLWVAEQQIKLIDLDLATRPPVHYGGTQ